jgi:hypothetical protein
MNALRAVDLGEDQRLRLTGLAACVRASRVLEYELLNASR